MQTKSINNTTKPIDNKIKKVKKVKNSVKYNEVFKKLKIDETFTNPRKQKRIKYDTVKDSIVPKEDYAFQTDLLMLPKTKKDFRYLLVIVDLWSDEVDAEPLKTKTPVEVLKAIKTIFKRPHLNKPYHIKSDAGTEFQGVVKTYFYDNSIVHAVALPGRHKQMGNVENTNKLLSRFLMTYLSNKERELNKAYNEWTDILSNVIKEINIIRKRPNGDPFAPHKPANMKLIENQKYKIGDLVYRKLDIPKNSLNNFEKSDPKFRMGDLRFDIHEPKKIKYVDYTPNNVRYIINGYNNVSYTEDELMPANDKYEKFGVRKIIDKQTKQRKVYYKVWWKKSLKKDSTWEPKKNLIEDGLKDKIDEFEKELKNKDN